MFQRNDFRCRANRGRDAATQSLQEKERKNLCSLATWPLYQRGPHVRHTHHCHHCHRCHRSLYPLAARASVLERRVRWNNDRLFSMLVFLGESLSLSLFSYVSLLLLYTCSHIYPRECICSYTHTRYATHVTVYIENVYAYMYNISIETRRFSILQVCNVYAGQWSGRRAIFALCPAGWKRRERRTIETGKVRAKLAGKRDARGFYAHVEENLYRKREFSLFLFSFLLLCVLFKVATTRRSSVESRVAREMLMLMHVRCIRVVG